MKNRIVLCTVAPVSHRIAEENLGLGYLASSLSPDFQHNPLIITWVELVHIIYALGLVIQNNTMS